MAVTDEAIADIKAMIVAGELAPGDRLPPEKELAERLGISRNSMREAVKALEVIRVLDVRRGDGTYVTSLAPELLLEAISFVIDLHDDDSMLEVFAVRRVLEAHASSVAATLAEPADLAVLRAEIAAGAMSASVDELVEHDARFHSAIARMTGNGYLASLIEGLSSQTIRARVWRGLTEQHAVEQSLREHEAIADALEQRDSALAAALTTAHIAGVERWLAHAAHGADAGAPGARGR